MKQLVNKNAVLFATGGIPTATDVLTTENAIMVNPNVKNIDYKEYGSGSAGNDKSVVNEDYVTVDFNADIIARTGGALGVAPKFAALLKCCGLKETINAAASVVYTPELIETPGTAIAYLDGYKRDVTGIAGDFSFSGEVGQFAKFKFSLKGFTVLEETAEINPTTTLDVNTKLIVKSAVALTVGGSEIDLKSFDFNLGNDVKEVYAANVKEFYVSDFKPTVKVNAIKTKGNGDHWTELKANTKKVIVITLGTVGGNIIELSAPFCQPTNTSESDSDAKVVYERTWLCENSAGADNFSLTFK